MDTTCTNMLITAIGEHINWQFDERMMCGHYTSTNMLITTIFTRVNFQFGRRMIYGHNLYEYVDYSDWYTYKTVV